MRTLIIGIDVGVKTGLAIYDRQKKKLEVVSTLKIHEAMEVVRNLSERIVKVVVEDATQVRFKTDPAKAQGAGSIKRDVSIWRDMLTDYEIPFELRRPNKFITKWDAERFALQTGWKERTSVHGRDAAMMVWGS